MRQHRSIALQTTNRSFASELPRLLKQRKLTLRAIARDVGGVDHAYLSRMINGKTPVNAGHAQRIARHLGLPADYFPEVREAAVINAVHSRPRLRDEIYFERLAPPAKRRSRSQG